MHSILSILRKSFVISLLALVTACATQQSSLETVRICNSGGCVDRPKGYTAPDSPTTVTTEENPQIESLKKLAAQNPSAAYDLALRFFSADGVRQDSYQAIQWMRDAAERGNLKAQMALGRLYLTGLGEMGADPGEAEKWLLITVNRGDKEAANLLKEATKARRSTQARHQWENRWRPNFYNDWYRNYPYNWQWGANQWMPMQPVPPGAAPYPPSPLSTGPTIYDVPPPPTPLMRENQQAHPPTPTTPIDRTQSETVQQPNDQHKTGMTTTLKQDNANLTITNAAATTDNIKANQSSTRRVALIIGNGAYQHIGRLSNPTNDAHDIAQALKKNNFQVILKTDATLETMADAIHHFGESLKGGGVGLFYYSGHGIQVKGENYLLPIDTNLAREDEVKRKAINAHDILEKMGEGKSHLNLVFLDACRNNPFPSSSRGVNRGLTSMDAPSGTLLVFSTNPNNVAEDGTGRNGTYTKHLLKYIGQPGLEVGMMLRQVRTKVKEETGGKQVPWENGSIEGTFYFNENTSK